MTIFISGIPGADRDAAERAYALDRAADDALAALQALIRLAAAKPNADQAPLYDAERALRRFIRTVSAPAANAWWRHYNPLPDEGERNMPAWGTRGT